MKQLLLIAFPVAVLLAADAASADTTVTITENNTSCQATTPAAVTPPATPSASAGVQAARNRNFAMAQANFKPLAESGDVEAQRDMGQLLMQDCTGIQDKEAAATWLTKAADGGDVPAQAQLGNAYMTGNGVAQDDTKAIPLLTKAATAGNGNAQANLGYMYSAGRGVPKDLHQYIVWTVKGGEQGTPVALMNIAEGYLKGEALPQDNDKAAYYMTAAAQRATGAQRTRFLAAVNNLSRQMSLADFKREAERAQRWSPGPGSLSDVLDEAARRQKQGSQG